MENADTQSNSVTYAKHKRITQPKWRRRQDGEGGTGVEEGVLTLSHYKSIFNHWGIDNLYSNVFLKYKL